MRHALIVVATLATLASLLIAPTSAIACGGGRTSELRFLGWTQDSRFAAYEEVLRDRLDEDGGAEEEDGGEYTVTLRVAVDGSTGDLHKHLVKLEGRPPGHEAAEYRALPPASRFTALGRLVSAKPSDRSPDGTRRLLILDGKWKNVLRSGSGVFGVGPGVDEDDNRGAVQVTVAFQSGDRTFLARDWESGECTGFPSGSLTAYWSPDGRRVAFVSEKRGCMGMHESEMLIVTVGDPAGPSVQLLADKGVSSARLDEAQEALKKAGTGYVALGSTKDPRTRTVVYYNKGNEQAAAAVAKAVPGGATVEPLTWRSVFDLVLALAAR